MGAGSFLGVKQPGSGVDHTRSEDKEREELSIPLLPVWAFVACSRVTFTFTSLNT